MTLEGQEVRTALQMGHVVDITTVGRRTQQPRRIEINFHNVDGRLYISGIPRRERRNRLANLDANPEFIFHLKGHIKAFFPLARGSSARRRILATVAAAWGRADLEAMVRFSPLIEVTLMEPIGG